MAEFLSSFAGASKMANVTCVSLCFFFMAACLLHSGCFAEGINVGLKTGN